MKRNKVYVGMVLVMALLLAVSLVATGCGGKDESAAPDASGAPAAPAKAVELGIVSPFPTTNTVEWQGTQYFIDKVNKELEGKVKLIVKGGPEVFPAAEQPEAVKTGAIDIMFGSALYWVPFFPEANALKLQENSPMEARKNGAYDFYNQKWEEICGVKYLFNTQTGNNYFYTFLTRPVDKPDLTGFLMRTAPIYEPIRKALNASGTTVPVAELATALERKVIDGYFYAMLGAEKMGLEDFLEGFLDYGFNNSESPMVINLEKWNSLPKDVQDKMMEIAEEAEARGWDITTKSVQESRQALIDKGLKTFKFADPADEKIFYDKIKDATWAEIKETCPDSYDFLVKTHRKS